MRITKPQANTTPLRRSLGFVFIINQENSVMSKQFAAITAVEGWLPEDVLSNADLEKMVDTSDEWIKTRTGITERRILRDPDKASAYLGAKAVQRLINHQGLNIKEVDLIICATATPDMIFPSTANLIAHEVGAENAFCYDLSAACSSFVYALATASKFVESGSHKKVLVVGADKMSSIVDYEDRRTCVIFGDAGAAVVLEPSADYGVQDFVLRSDGSGKDYLNLKGGGSLHPASQETIASKAHYLYQDGQPVFKAAVNGMANTIGEVMQRNDLVAEDISWVVPHQANKRIIDMVARTANFPLERVMVNIHKYGNTTNATIPLCLWEWQDRLKPGDNVILTAFGGGFSWGSLYLTWAYDGNA